MRALAYPTFVGGWARKEMQMHMGKEEEEEKEKEERFV